LVGLFGLFFGPVVIGKRLKITATTTPVGGIGVRRFLTRSAKKMVGTTYAPVIQICNNEEEREQEQTGKKKLPA
jgi:hypothetical protein